MRPTYTPTRRAALQLFASVPLMPMTVIGSSSLLLTACGGSDSVATPVATATAKSVKFNNMAAPTTDVDRATTFTNATIDVTYSDASVKAAQPLKYNLIYKTGTTLPRPDGGTALTGGYYDINNNPIIDTTGTTPLQAFSDCPDGQSLLKLANPSVSGVAGNTVFLVTQFEYQTVNNAQGEARPGGGVYTNNLPAGITSNSMYGKMPSQYGITTLSQDKTTGALTAVYYYPVPTANVHGMWITCASSLSPWNTHLSSEEYEPDAWAVAITGDSSGYFRAFSLNTFGSDSAANPYHYGHVPEVTVRPDGTGSVKKHFCMGRISREKVQVMPDNKTVLMGDDATSGGIFMFVADVAGELSSGTLYAAKLTQTNAAGATDGGAFTMTWIKLGHATSSEIEAIANSFSTLTGLRPAGPANAARGIIADVVQTKLVATSGYNLINFASGTSLYVKATSDLSAAIATEADLAGYTLVNYGNAQQFVKFVGALNTTNKAAAFLESHRFAAAMGATMEFTKLEGVTVNAKDKKAYFAMSAIKDTMKANGFIDNPIGGNTTGATGDAVKLTAINSGGTYEVVLGTDGTIGSDWVPTSMSVPAALLGQDITPADANGNSANADKIANTDNVWFSESMRTLFIGEDSGMHVNNFIWAYNVDTASLSRIYSAPSGAECTGLQAVDDLNGFAYVMANFQHPGDWEGIHSTLLTATGSTLNATINSNWGNKKQAAVGYLSGIPKLG